MNCVPGFVNLLWESGIFVLSGGILYQIIQIDDEFEACNQRKLWKVWFMMCNMIVLGVCLRMWNAEVENKLCLLILAVYLVVCCTMDSMLGMVNDFMQYVGVVGGCFWTWNHLSQIETGFSLLFFVLVQHFVFRKMYGEADVTAFVICALYLTGDNKGIETYLVHMGVCYLLLAIVQSTKKNINIRGNLKNPVPLYPYISASFLLIFYQ